MPGPGKVWDYAPVTRSRQARSSFNETAEDAAQSGADSSPEDGFIERAATPRPMLPDLEADKREPLPRSGGHALSYACLFLFTAVLYFRPYEFIPALSALSLAFWLGVLTLLIFIPSQFGTEGRLTARPREVNLVLLLCLMGLLSIPLALSPGEAWSTFSDTFIKAVLIFIVMINVVRTERRLRGLFFLALAVSCVLSLGAIIDYQQGKFAVEGYRVEGIIGGLFGNPNDMAIHLVTMTPLAVALSFNARGLLKKAIYGACAVLCVAATVLTYSRGGFLALVSVGVVLAWKIGRNRRFTVMLLSVVVIAAFIALAPGNYGERILSIFGLQPDPVGSASARRDLLFHSVKVALRNPFGVGMGNYHIMSAREAVNHNAYAQVATEMGLIALIIYVMFLLTALGRLRRLEREVFGAQPYKRFYYLAIGLQSSLIGYMVSSFFGSVAYQWYVYYLVGYAVCLGSIYQATHRSATMSRVPAESVIERPETLAALDGRGA